MVADPDDTRVQLTSVQHAALLDSRLLIAARQHVGSAGIEQISALERLIAAGQEHTGLAQAAKQVMALLQQQPQDSETVQSLVLQSERQVLWMNELASVVSTSLLQITATPVQRISAEVLQDITDRMQRQLSALEHLIAAARERLVGPDAAAPTLDAIQATMQAELARIAQDERRGHLETLLHLAERACADLVDMRDVTALDRMAALQHLIATAHQHRERLAKQP